MTDDNKIEQLLKVFYNGDTTPEEEALLFKFLNNENVEEKWHTDRNILNALYDSSEITLPKGINERLENVLNKHIEETSIPKIEIRHKKRPLQLNTRRFYIALTSSAAAILICIGIFFITNKQSSSDFIADTYANPEEAAIVAEKVLLLVSSRLNQGFTPLEKVKESVDKTNEILYENLKIND